MALTTALMVIGATLSTSLPAERPAQNLRAVTMRSSLSKRPAPLMPLYASLTVLQSLDLYTTSAAISRGANEANPAMRPFAGKTVTGLAVKVLATASTIYFTERAWKRNRKGAIVLMTAINVASAAIVAHNTRVAKRD